MNRIDRTFQELGKKKALITFVTAGDPSLDVTKELVLTMLQNGADIVEIGIPFSDPIAEGETIQRASLRARKGGVTLEKTFAMVRELRRETDAPLLFMMYLNTIFRFGTERFFALCEECGIDGVIVPDLPYEERFETLSAAQAHGIRQISMVTPTSHGRIAAIAKEAEGFLYCVSSTGVTGVRNGFSTDFESFFAEIRKNASIPCAVGFGISTPEQAHEMSRYCDGVIVGSGVVRLAEAHGAAAAAPVAAYVRNLKAAINPIDTALPS